MTSSADIRQGFLDFFRERGHDVVPGSSLLPANDPTLLFTNAGMVPFKEVFLGAEKRPYKRAASAQRCVRAGGKHNDLENVGYTARHHTFFEMLGNFSFGDYFKREAIEYDWEYLTGELGLAPEKLWITVFDQDEEAAAIWLDEIGVSPERFSRIGEKDNFWSMGETGPCGPCSEIFYDHGPELEGGPPGTPEEDGDRYVEIWNLVFMQYQRSADGELTPLPHPSVDTGMGLERIAAVMQGVHDNYRIDLFQRLIGATAEMAGCDDPENSSLKVIADHIRAAAFLVTDGVIPSNEGRGYVLRRIIRRAIRHGHKLGLREPFFHRLVAPLEAEMGEAYTELSRERERVEQVLQGEEIRFAETLDQGMALLEQTITGLDGKVIPGEQVFRLYDTYGFPVDLTADVARERGLELDLDGFDRAMDAQRKRARAASRFDDSHQRLDVSSVTEFSGYERHRDSARVTELFREGKPVESLQGDEEGVVVLDRTPFYGESGGQVGDTGVIEGDGFRFEVYDTRKQGGGKALAHFGRLVEGRLAPGAAAESQIDEARRADIRRNHSATHLMNAALHEILGDHVAQKGSLVAPDRLRFDFSHPQPLTPEELRRIEDFVNQEVLANHEARTEVMPYQRAIAAGAMALAGESYAEEVRVLRLGPCSMELCGGTHVDRTGDIGLFRIIAESGVAAGVRRIEAVTGLGALAHVRGQQALIDGLSERLRTSPDGLEARVEQLQSRYRSLEKELETLRARLASGSGRDLADEAEEIHGVKLVAAQLEGADVATLRNAVDQLKNRLGTAVVVLGGVEEDRVRLVAGVSKSAVDRVAAGDLVRMVAEQVGGKGGGRPDMAQGGGDRPEALANALASVPAWLRQQLDPAG